MQGFRVRDVCKDDVNEIARVHCLSFPDRTLIQLGSEAVRRYYAFLLEEFPRAKVICAVAEGGAVAGFCFAGSFSGSFSNFIRLNFGFLIIKVLTRPWLVFSPLMWELAKPVLKVTKWMIHHRREEPSVSVISSEALLEIDREQWGILAIAVDPAFQRRGVGDLLMAAVEEDAIGRGVVKMDLSVHVENQPAVRFYEKLGWQKLLVSGQWNGKMIKWLN